MSRHSENAAIARQNHKYIFGEATGIEYRETANCDWVAIVDGVLHSEFIANVRKGSTFAKVTKRNLFCDASQVSKRINAQVRIGGEWGPTYIVVDITTRGTDRYQLHLQRSEIVEVTRPGYRMER